MTHEESRKKVLQVLKSMGIAQDPIPMNESLRDLGLDSLKTMDLVLTLEDAFGVQVPEEDLVQDKLGTAASILALFEHLANSKQG